MAVFCYTLFIEMMPDYLAVVNRIIQEHTAIRKNIQQVGESVSDRESAAVLYDIRSGWVPGRLDILIEKCHKLQSTMNLLADGMRNHFDYEQNELPPLIGGFLMEAIFLDHRDIKVELERARNGLAETKLEGLSGEEILVAELKIQQMVNSVIHLIEEHALREEVVLTMLKVALEQKK